MKTLIFLILHANPILTGYYVGQFKHQNHDYCYYTYFEHYELIISWIDECPKTVGVK